MHAPTVMMRRHDVASLPLLTCVACLQLTAYVHAAPMHPCGSLPPYPQDALKHTGGGVPATIESLFDSQAGPGPPAVVPEQLSSPDGSGVKKVVIRSTGPVRPLGGSRQKRVGTLSRVGHLGLSSLRLTQVGSF